MIDGARSGELFRAYARQERVPHLRPGDIAVTDNLVTHKVAEAVRARDADLVYPPAYRPDMNPIEPVFSKVENELRRRELRSIAAREAAFGECLDWITNTDATNYFANAGYPPGSK